MQFYESYEEDYLICLSFRGLSFLRTVVKLYFREPLVCFFLFHLKNYLWGDFSKEHKRLTNISYFSCSPSSSSSFLFPEAYLAGIPVLWRTVFEQVWFFPWALGICGEGQVTLMEIQLGQSWTAILVMRVKIFSVLLASLCCNSAVIAKFAMLLRFSWLVTVVVKAW